MCCIEERVHDLYWKDDINCARTMLLCLSELFDISLEQQTIYSAIGMHGAGGYRAQCGLVEGGLMFIGIYGKHQGKPEDEIVSDCFRIDRYLEKGDMFVLDDHGIKGECVVTKEEEGVYELKNIAVLPESQRKGYGKELDRICNLVLY